MLTKEKIQGQVNKLKDFLTEDRFKDCRYEFKDEENIKKALDSTKDKITNSGKSNKNYRNQSLATLGDAVIKLILSEYLFEKGYNKQDITKIKEMFENGKYFNKICDDNKIFEFSYNDDYIYTEAPIEANLPSKKHNNIFEAIIGAMYVDAKKNIEKLETIKNFVLKILEVK